MTMDEQQLRDALRGRAEAVDASGDFAESSIALARRRTRRRIAATAMAACAVLGGLATVALPREPEALPPPAQSTSTAPGPSASATPSAAPTPSSSPTPAPSSSPTPTTPSETPPGSEVPLVPWAADGAIHLGDRTLPAPEGRVVVFAPLDTGGVVVTTTPSHRWDPDARGHLLDAGGRVLREFGRDWKASRGGSLVAYRGGDEVAVRASSGELVARRAIADLGVEPRSDLNIVLAVTSDTVYLQAEGGWSTVAWNVRSGDLRRIDGHLRAVSPDGSLGATSEAGCLSVVALRGPARAGQSTCLRVGSPVTFSDDGAYLLTEFETEGGYWEEHRVLRLSDMTVVAYSGDPTLPGWTGAFEPGTSRLVLSRNSSEPANANTSNDLVRCTVDEECRTIRREQPLPDGVLPAPHYVIAPSLVP